MYLNRGKGLADAEGVLSGAAPIRRQAAAPSLGLDIEVVEIGELSGRKEVVAHIADGALDAALLVAARHRYPVTDVESACKAIDVIVEQGEGTRTSPLEGPGGEPAHWLAG